MDGTSGQLDKGTEEDPASSFERSNKAYCKHPVSTKPVELDLSHRMLGTACYNAVEPTNRDVEFRDRFPTYVIQPWLAKPRSTGIVPYSFSKKEEI